MSCGVVVVQAKRAAQILILDTRRRPGSAEAMLPASGGQNP